jgi:hypothetical protein
VGKVFHPISEKGALLMANSQTRHIGAWIAVGMIGVASLVAGGCRCGAKKDTLRATVDCAYQTAGVRCTVVHKKGKKPLSVCWDVTIKCENGTEIRGGGCQVVKPGAKAQKLIPAVELPNHSKCDKPVDSKVSNIRALRAVSD